MHTSPFITPVLRLFKMYFASPVNPARHPSIAHPPVKSWVTALDVREKRTASRCHVRFLDGQGVRPARLCGCVCEILKKRIVSSGKSNLLQKVAKETKEAENCIGQSRGA